MRSHGEKPYNQFRPWPPWILCSRELRTWFHPSPPIPCSVSPLHVFINFWGRRASEAYWWRVHEISPVERDPDIDVVLRFLPTRSIFLLIRRHVLKMIDSQKESKSLAVNRLLLSRRSSPSPTPRVHRYRWPRLGSDKRRTGEMHLS